LTLGGQAMSAADWEDPAAAGFRLRSEGYEIAIDRHARIVTLDGV